MARLEQDLDMHEEAEMRRVELGNDSDSPEPAPAPAFVPAPTGRLMQSSLLGGAAMPSTARRERIAAAVQAAGPIVRQKQVEHFFTDFTCAKPGSQNASDDCVFCGTTRKSSGSTRFVEHILTCNFAPLDIKEGFKMLVDKKSEKKAEKRVREVHLAEQDELDRLAHHAEQDRKRQRGIRAGLKSAAHNAADIAIANWFYANDIPSASAEATADELWHDMINKIKESPSNYIPPNANKLAGPLLDDAHALMLKKLGARDPAGLLKEKYCASYNTDGWDSTDHLPLINSVSRALCLSGVRAWKYFARLSPRLQTMRPATPS
jgi:hypothetical protein